MATTLKEKTVSGFLYKMAERVGAHGVNFVVSIVLARLLLPQEYGLVALSLVLITILDVFVTYGFGIWASACEGKRRKFFTGIAIVLALLLPGLIALLA